MVKTLKAYAEENSLPITYAYDEEINANRKLITGFASIDDVQKCVKYVGGNPCLFEESENERLFLGELDLEGLELADIKQVGVFKLSKYDRQYLREDRCPRCKFSSLCVYRLRINYCSRTKRKGSIERAHYCEKFMPRNSKDMVYRNGMPVRSKTSTDYRTANQWMNIGRTVREGEIGIEMYATMASSKTCLYYLVEQTEER